MNEIAIQARDVYKVFHKQRGHLPWERSDGHNGRQQAVALDRVSFEVRVAEIFGVLGPNGSGKSTLVRVIATLLLPDGGTVTVFGHDVMREAIAVQRLINRVSVEASFFKKLSPMENLIYGARLYGLSAAESRTRIIEILTRLGVERWAIDQPVERMSRGVQQKVAIARALLTRPALLLLDEPTSGLDPRSKREVQALIRELRDLDSTTILLTTHDMLEAESLCERIAIMDAGRIVALDTPEALRGTVALHQGHPPTLEDVFLELTGKLLTADGK